MITGRLLGIGVGPGDPELITLKAVRYLQRAPVVAYISANGQRSIARRIAAPHLPSGKREINLALPMHPRPEITGAAYEEGAARISTELEQGRDVAVLCEGDPLLYGSFGHLFERLGDDYPTEIVPGVMSITAAAAAAKRPLVARTEVLTLVPATLASDALVSRLEHAEAGAILKLGRHLARVREVLVEMGRLEQAIYVEQVSTGQQKILPLTEVTEDVAPYFALVLLPRARGS